MLLIDCDTNVHQRRDKKTWKGYFFSSKEYDYRVTSTQCLGLVCMIMLKSRKIEQEVPLETQFFDLILKNLKLLVGVVHKLC